MSESNYGLEIYRPVPDTGNWRNYRLGALTGDNSTLMSGPEKKVIPVACINPSQEILPFHKRDNIKNTLERLMSISHIPETILEEILVDLNKYKPENRSRYYHWKSAWELTPEEERKQVLPSIVRQVKERLENYFDSPLAYAFADNIPNVWGNLWKYHDLINHFWRGFGFSVMRTRHPNVKFLVGRYYLAAYNYNTGITTPLACLVTQPKYVKLIRLSHIMGEPVDSKYFQFWVKDDFDVVRSEYRLLRPRYRKFIKKPMEEAGIPIITKPNLRILFKRFQGVKCNTLKEYHQFLKDSSEEILYHLKEKHGLLEEEEKEALN